MRTFLVHYGRGGKLIIGIILQNYGLFYGHFHKKRILQNSKILLKLQ